MAAAAEPASKVITGHFGVAAGAKVADYRAPLWALMTATVWLDLVFVPLLLLNIETIDTLPGGGYGNRVIHADYTHSLLGALVLCAAFGAVAWWRWDRRLGVLLGAVAFSHWVLDLIVHRETCRSCLATPVTCHCSASGSGECQSWRSRWRRHCFFLESFSTGEPPGRWDRDPAAGSLQRL